MQYTAVIKQDGPWWLGWTEEIPGVNCQEDSYDGIVRTLEITLREAIASNVKDAIEAAGLDYRELAISV